jgi:hypothetical protein
MINKTDVEGFEVEKIEYLRDLAVRNKRRIAELVYELKIEKARANEYERELYQLRQQVDEIELSKAQALSAEEVRDYLKVILAKLS